MLNYCQYQEAQTEQALFVSVDWNNPQDFGESELLVYKNLKPDRA